MTRYRCRGPTAEIFRKAPRLHRGADRAIFAHAFAYRRAPAARGRRACSSRPAAPPSRRRRSPAGRSPASGRASRRSTLPAPVPAARRGWGMAAGVGRRRLRGDADPVRARQQAHHVRQHHLPPGHRAALPAAARPAGFLQEPVRPRTSGSWRSSAVGLVLFFVGTSRRCVTAPDPARGNLLVALRAAFVWALTICGLRWMGSRRSRRGSAVARGGRSATCSPSSWHCRCALPFGAHTAGGLGGDPLSRCSSRSGWRTPAVTRGLRQAAGARGLADPAHRAGAQSGVGVAGARRERPGRWALAGRGADHRGDDAPAAWLPRGGPPAPASELA